MFTDEIYWEGLAQCYEQGLAANVGVWCVGRRRRTLSSHHWALSSHHIVAVA